MADEGTKRPGFRADEPGDEIDPDAPASAEEIAASQRLRDALEDPSLPNEDADLARALKAAWAPEPIAGAELGSIVETSLDPAEVHAAARLRDALEGKPEAASPEAELARALLCAWNPTPLSEAEHNEILARALGTNVVAFRRRASTQTRVVRVTFGFAGVLALAASVFLLVRAGSHGDAEVPLALARSTQPLFSEPFRTGDASARIDKIAMARASDFRDNRFAKWGVR